MTKKILETLLNFELNIIKKKKKVRRIIGLGIKPYSQKNWQALMNFELKLIHKNKPRSIVEFQTKTYSEKQS